MSLPTSSFRCNSYPLSQSRDTFQSFLPFQPLISASTFNYRPNFRPFHLSLQSFSRLGDSRKVDFVCRASETDSQSEGPEDKGKDGHESGESTSFAASNVHNDLQLNQEEEVATDVVNSDSNTVANSNETQIDGQLTIQDGENIQVASGSPLPGLKPQQLDESIRIPKETIDILRDQVFGFDTFFVTGQEPYEGFKMRIRSRPRYRKNAIIRQLRPISRSKRGSGGVLFKGNLRGVPAKTYEKISKRMEGSFGDQYKLFLLINPEDDKPVAVVVPRKTLQPETTAVPEWFAAGAFGLVTVFTLLLRNVPALQSNLLSSFDNLDQLKNGLPGALVTALILGVHELGHYLAAKDCGVKLGIPYFVPSWQIGSFGAITRILNIVSKREDLLKVAAAGPLAGYALGLSLFLLGFFVPPSDGLGIVVDASVFHESFLAGGIAKLLLGDVLNEGQAISINPLVIWAWAGLLINAINSIPAGELDGGRIAFALWGRKASARLTGLSILLLGLSSLFSDVAFYWAILIFFLQRGPIAPLAEEITEPDQKYQNLGIAVLLLGLLVCLPYPFPFTDQGMMTF